METIEITKLVVGILNIGVAALLIHGYKEGDKWALWLITINTFAGLDCLFTLV